MLSIKKSVLNIYSLPSTQEPCTSKYLWLLNVNSVRQQDHVPSKEIVTLMKATEVLLKGCPLVYLLNRSFTHQKLRLCYGHGPGCGCGESVTVFSGSFGLEYTKMSFPHMAGSMLLPSLGTGSIRNSRRHEDTVCGLGTAS